MSEVLHARAYGLAMACERGEAAQAHENNLGRSGGDRSGATVVEVARHRSLPQAWHISSCGASATRFLGSQQEAPGAQDGGNRQQPLLKSIDLLRAARVLVSRVIDAVLKTPDLALE